MTGAIGYISVATKGEEGPGEVEVPHYGSYVAWSREPLNKGVEVIGTGTRATRTRNVQPTVL